MSQHIQTIQIEGMTCDACVKLITKKFSKIPGVTQVISVDKRGVAEVSVETDISKEVYENALAGTLYFVTDIN